MISSSSWLERRAVVRSSSSTCCRFRFLSVDFFSAVFKVEESCSMSFCARCGAGVAKDSTLRSGRGLAAMGAVP